MALIKKNMKKSIKENSKETNITPLGDRVLVRPKTVEEIRNKKGAGHFGIIVPDSMTKEKSAEGTVLAVGVGRYVDGKLIPPNVKVGDTIIFSKYSYDEVLHGDEELYLLREDNILAVIKN